VSFVTSSCSSNPSYSVAMYLKEAFLKESSYIYKFSGKARFMYLE
jgi:hypothetical protein